MGSHQSQKRTAKHAVVRAWADARGGVPARVRGTTDALRIKLGADDPLLEAVAWDAWFEVFDAEGLAFVYEDPGYSSKVVKRNGREDTAEASPATTPVESSE